MSAPNNILELTAENFARFEKELSDMVIAGLPKGHIGFVISPPDTGKGFLSLSIAYTGATGLPFIPIAPANERFKTLYWSAEEKSAIAFKRVHGHLSQFSDAISSQIIEYVKIYDCDEPLVCRGNRVQRNDAVINELIKAATNFDLLIIDTAREAFGPAHEVDDDFLIKEILQDIAVKSDVAILVTHHPTKAVTRGTETISSVSGSGLSRTLANARLHLYLEKIEKSNQASITLRYSKANLLSRDQRRPTQLQWLDAGLLVSSDFNLAAINQSHTAEKIETTPQERPVEKDASKPHRVRSSRNARRLKERLESGDIEPSVIDVSDFESENPHASGDKDADTFMSSITAKIGDLQ